MLLLNEDFQSDKFSINKIYLQMTSCVLPLKEDFYLQGFESVKKNGQLCEYVRIVFTGF